MEPRAIGSKARWGPQA